MTTLIFATNNQHKIEEIRKGVGNDFSVITLTEAGINIDIPEPFNTLEENARTKSATIHNLTQKNCFSEDTGLEVFALNNEPGVRSARYAGKNAGSEDNIDKLLGKMAGIANRAARFRTVISLIYNDKEYLCEGICTGNILTGRIGKNGFGYDSIFVPDGSSKSFAQMEIEEKNIFSHRKKAVSKLIDILKTLEKQ